jgi:general secretion pathway protein E
METGTQDESRVAPPVRAPRIPFQFAKQHYVCVASAPGKPIEIAYVPAETGAPALVELRRLLSKPFKLKPVSVEHFQEALAHAYSKSDDQAQAALDDIEDSMDMVQAMEQLPQATDLLAFEEDAPIIRLLNAVLTQAIKEGVSDVHLEIYEEDLVVRFRQDGVLREVLTPPRTLGPLLISRLKIMAKLDIAEKRLPQDGRITLRIAGRSVDVRVSTLPTQFGERVVLRLLDQKNAKLDLAHLGMDEESQTMVEDLLKNPHGIILVTGPTGSGKTTTLYAMLTEMNDVKRNIMTVEDPIEYHLQGISQTQVNPKVELTFARGLRAILRQDPDVVMVGEIRDVETAEMAVQASLTGHLVLSTLHTNSTTGAITRLRDMGVEPFLLSATLIGVIAQRLVRRLCLDCKVEESLTAAEGALMGIKTVKGKHICHKVGCEACHFTGFIGRLGLYEIMLVTPEMAYKIHERASQADLRKIAAKQSRSMREKGFAAVLEGTTTIDEVLRVTTEDQ